MPVMTSGRLYADLSSWYDRFCDGIDYAEQAAFLHRAVACFCESGGQDYLDLGCGTGVLMAAMGEQGYRVSGLDLSADMLAVAAQRCPQAALIHGDMAGLAADAAYDLVSCLLYSLHYSHPRAAMAETVRRVYRALKPGGVFLFDTVDRDGIQTRDSVSRLTEGADTFTFRSGWRYPGQGETMTLHLSIASEGPQGVSCREDRHAMTAIGREELSDMLRDAGFALTVLERDFSRLQAWGGQSRNMILAAVRPGGSST